MRVTLIFEASFYLVNCQLVNTPIANFTLWELTFLLLGSLVPFIFIMLGYSLDVGDGFDLQDNLPPYVDALVHTFLYSSALVTSISACAPMMLESILDFISGKKRNASSKYIQRREIFFIIVLPDIFIIAYLLPYRQFDILSAVLSVRDTLLHFAFLHYLHNLCPLIWTKVPLIFVASFIMIGNALGHYLNMKINDQAILIRLYFKWFIYAAQIEDIDTKRRMKFCHAYAMLYGVIFVVDWLPGLIAGSDKNWSFICGINYVTMTTYVSGASAMILSLVTSRLSRYDDAIDNVNEIKISAHIALSILNDMLLLDKVNSGSLQLNKTMFDPWTAVRDTIQSMMIQARESGVEIKYGGSQDILPGLLQNYVIDGDKAKLDQVIRNLLSNALKFTPQGKCVHINIDIEKTNMKTNMNMNMKTLFYSSRSSIFKLNTNININSGCNKKNKIHPQQSTSNQDLSNHMLRIEVMDEGIDISAEDQQKLFNQEIHFSPGELQNGGGTGIGLLISKGIMDAHKGRITVFSEGKGHGTTFTIYIPLQSKQCLDNGNGNGNYDDQDLVLLPCDKPLTRGFSICSITDSTPTRELPRSLVMTDNNRHSEKLQFSICTEHKNNSHVVFDSEKTSIPSVVVTFENASGKFSVDSVRARALIVDDSNMTRKMMFLKQTPQIIIKFNVIYNFSMSFAIQLQQSEMLPESELLITSTFDTLNNCSTSRKIVKMRLHLRRPRGQHMCNNVILNIAQSSMHTQRGQNSSYNVSHVTEEKISRLNHQCERNYKTAKFNMILSRDKIIAFLPNHDESDTCVQLIPNSTAFSSLNIPHLAHILNPNCPQQQNSRSLSANHIKRPYTEKVPLHFLLIFASTYHHLEIQIQPQNAKGCENSLLITNTHLRNNLNNPEFLLVVHEPTRALTIIDNYYVPDTIIRIHITSRASRLARSSTPNCITNGLVVKSLRFPLDILKDSFDCVVYSYNESPFCSRYCHRFLTTASSYAANRMELMILD
eukprot:gene2223-4321_t